MTVALFGGIGFLLVLGLVLGAALLLRPSAFIFKITLTRWIALELEMRAKHNSDGVQQQDAATKPPDADSIQPP